MNKILSLKLNKLSVILLSGFLLMLIFMWGFMFALYNQAENNRKVSARNFQLLEDSSAILKTSDYMTNLVRFYAVTGDKQYLDAYWKEVNETQTRDKTLQNMKNIGIPQYVLLNAEKGKQASDELIKLEEKSFEAQKNGSREKAMSIVLGPEYAKEKEIVDGYLHNFAQDVTDYAIKLSKDHSASLIKLIVLCAVIMTVMAVFFTIVMGLFFKTLTKAMGELNFLFGQIADGDMTVKAPVLTGESEIYETYRSVNIFILNISDILRNVISSSEEVASGNNQLSATMEELFSTFQGQTSQVNENAESMNSVNLTVKNTVDKLDKNSAIINGAVEKAYEGRSKLSDLKGSMENIHTQANSLSNTINKLTESSEEIGNIVTVINDIADQTNLLALNAAIEAARAGEAGRGFAVVADEVRKLAERTQKATGEIKTIISTLQSDSSSASKEMEDASLRVKEGVQGIEETEKVFGDIFAAIDTVKNTTTAIARDISEEYDVLQKINSNSQAVASGIEESNVAVEEVTKTVSHLQQRVEALKAMVSRFRV